MASISIPELIAIKQHSDILSKEQIEWFIDELMKGNIHDAQLGAMLMAIFLQGKQILLLSCYILCV